VLRGTGHQSRHIPLIVCRSIGLTGVGGSRRQSEGTWHGATVTKEVVNICPGVYLGMLAPQSRFEVGRVQMNMLA
jgi:hypothetical protein